MVSPTLFSEKGLKVLSRSASAAASRLAIMGSKENQHKLFEWTHSKAKLSQEKQSDFIDIEEDKFIDEILDFDNDLCKRTFFMVSPQGTGKSELCLCVKHAYEKKFLNKEYPPVLYIQRDAPAIRYLNKKSAMSKWLGDEIDEEILSVFKREDRSEETLMKIINDNNYDAVYESIASRIKYETGLTPFSKELSSESYFELKRILKKNLKYYLAAQFPNNEGASEISNHVSPRSKFFDPKDNKPTSRYRIYAETLHMFFGGSVTKAKVYELLNSAVEGSLGGGIYPFSRDNRSYWHDC